jgi:predicted ATPase
VERKEGHVSIKLRQRTISVNVADTGYGVSQILPVLAQIWWATQIPRNYTRQMRHGLRPITMEQPELHLHPAHQAKLADVFQSAIERSNASGPEAVLLIETHSEALINRLGELIEYGKIAANDVQVVIFSARGEGEELNTEISTSTFDDNGALRDWPYGFFNY